MKTRLILFLTVIFSFFQSNAQIQLHDGSNHGLMRISTKESEKLKEVEGSPYLNEGFLKGSVTVTDKEPLEVFMRYNAYHDQIEIKLDPDASETYLLPKSEKDVYKIGDKDFRLKKIQTEEGVINGYFQVLFEGNNVELLKKFRVEVTEPVKARTGYEKDRPAEIILQEEYYLDLRGSSAKKLEVSDRKIRKTLQDDKILEYLKNNKIRTEEDLVILSGFIDKNM